MAVYAADEIPQILDQLPGRSRCSTHGPYAVLYTVMDKIVDDYGPVLEGLQNDIDEIEVQVFDG